MNGDSMNDGDTAVKTAAPICRTILVVDDDPETSQAIGEMLKHLGNAPVLCCSALDALLQVHTEKFDLMLIDYRMPELTGIDLITMLREEGCHIPVIMMTGFLATENRISSEKLGIVAILKKPIVSEQLVTTIEGCFAPIEPASKANV